MTARIFRLMALLRLTILTLLLLFIFTPLAGAASIMMCKPPSPGQGSAGPGRVTMAGTGNSYTTDRWGCAAFLASDVGEATANGFAQTGSLRAIQLSGATAAAQIGQLPPAAYIVGIIVQNQGANAPTGGGLKIGTTSGGTDIVSGMLATGNNAINIASDVSIAKRAFNMTQAQPVFVDAVTSWNSSTVIVTVLYSFF